MKKLLLLLLCVPLMFSCGKKNDEKTIEDMKLIGWVEKFGRIEKEPLSINDKDRCCEKYKFTLINTSFKKKIRFTLEREWHNHIHKEISLWFCNSKNCQYTNEEKEVFRQNIDTTRKMARFNREKENEFVTLSPGERKNLDIYPGEGEGGEGEDNGMCNCNNPPVNTIYSRPLVRNYIVVGEVEIVEE